MAREFNKVGVVGLGTMGAGIAEVLARSGIEVVGIETEQQVSSAVGPGWRARPSRRHQGQAQQEDATALLGRFSAGTDLAAMKDCDLVVEAVPENLEVKKALFAELDALLPQDAVLATNT